MDPAAQLLRDLHEALPQLGITRVARQTDLDRTGVPCYAAIRPNSATISTHQGKGLDEVSAEISAVMEAAEYAFAERPEGRVQVLSAAEAEAAGYRSLDFRGLRPHGAIVPDGPISWLAGEWLDTGELALVPRDLIRIGTPPVDLPDISQSTNGLAAGPSRDHAVLHGLQEVIERDAVCLWGFRSDRAALATAFSPSALGDPELDALVCRLAAKGFRLNLFDLTTDIGVPVVYAVLAEAEDAYRHFDVATGASCHPVAAQAARRAIIEAAQTRISVISGARDDIADQDYDARLSRDIAVLAQPMTPDRAPPQGLAAAHPAADMLRHVRSRLDSAKLDRIAVVPLGGAAIGIHVVRVFVPGLEDRLTNKNWRPGPRAARAMLGLA